MALYARDGKIWLNQQQMAELFATSKQAVSRHAVNILKEKELFETSVVKQYLTTAADGKNYNVVFYSLEMILAVGFRVRGVRGIQFRQWANQHLSEYLVKGFTMDDERLKNPDGRPDYFDELLERVRDIRASSAICIHQASVAIPSASMCRRFSSPSSLTASSSACSTVGRFKRSILTRS